MSDRFRLYCGLVRNGNWYNYAEVQPLQGGVLAMLDGAEKSGAARLLNLMKGSVKTLFTEEGEEYLLKPQDYEDFKVVDTWKIGYEQIKLKTGEENPVIPESFYCVRCSQPKREQYTDVSESWQTLVDEGFIDEIFLDKPEFTYEVELPDPIEIPASKFNSGGTYKYITMEHISLGDMLKIHRNQTAMSSDANMIRATWDAAIVKVMGMAEAEFNRLKRSPDQSFAGRFIDTQANQDAIEEASSANIVGYDASDRVVYCKNCGNEIRGELDYTNFFSPLLPKKSSRNR